MRNLRRGAPFSSRIPAVKKPHPRRARADIGRIIQALKEERDLLDRAIAALESIAIRPRTKKAKRETQTEDTPAHLTREQPSAPSGAEVIALVPRRNEPAKAPTATAKG
jgi:hypothetical protein